MAYRPQDWHHDVLALSAEGEPLTTETESTTLVGPLCFSGDVLARQRTLPRLDEGDLVVLRDVGAYTMGMWSRHLQPRHAAGVGVVRSRGLHRAACRRVRRRSDQVLGSHRRQVDRLGVRPRQITAVPGPRAPQKSPHRLDRRACGHTQRVPNTHHWAPGGNHAAHLGILTASLLIQTSAMADVHTCFEGEGGLELRSMRVTYGPWWWQQELETDTQGCIDIPGSSPVAEVTVHATNRVVQMVDGGPPVAQTLWAVDGATLRLGVDHTVAERLRRSYNEGFRGWGPFDSASPMGGNLAHGPYITADVGSPMVVQLPYVEPAPLGLLPPRLHLRATDTDNDTLRHELAHALHLSQWSLPQRMGLTTYYLGWLLGPDNTHSWNEPSTDVVAFTEAFGGVGEVFHEIGNGSEADFLAEASIRAYTARTEASGDDTIESLVFGVLFEAFAHDVGLDYVISTYISCGAITLDDYGTCIRAEEGSNSWTFQALRSAARTYGYAFSRAPSLGDGTYYNDIFTCGVGEETATATQTATTACTAPTTRGVTTASRAGSIPARPRYACPCPGFRGAGGPAGGGPMQDQRCRCCRR